MRRKHQNCHILQSNHTSNLILQWIIQLVILIDLEESWEESNADVNNFYSSTLKFNIQNSSQQHQIY